MEATFIDSQTHLLVVCEGVWDPIAVTDVLARIGAEARRLGHRRLLIDWRGVSMPASDHFRAMAGEDAIKHLGPPLRVGVLVRRTLINKVAERAVVDGGVDAWVHHDLGEVLRWLARSPGDPPHPA